MKASFCYLAEPQKRLLTLEHEGQRFVPIFASPKDLQGFVRRCADQLAGYRLCIATDPADVAGFLQMLRDLSLHVGIAHSDPGDGGGEAAFSVLEPEALARALTEKASDGAHEPSRRAAPVATRAEG